MKKALRKIGGAAGAFLTRARGLLVAVSIAAWTLALPDPALAAAGSIGSSKLATGTEKLINDVTSWLLIVAPLVTVVAVIYYLIRKTVSDEIDHKKWNTRISTAIICCIGVVVASVIIKLIVSYYQ
jgi:nitric oxide reductase large subunit